MTEARREHRPSHADGVAHADGDRRGLRRRPAANKKSRGSGARNQPIVCSDGTVAVDGQRRCGASLLRGFRTGEAKAGATECVQVLLEAGAAVDARAKPSAAFLSEIESLQACSVCARYKCRPFRKSENTNAHKKSVRAPRVALTRGPGSTPRAQSTTCSPFFVLSSSAQ